MINSCLVSYDISDNRRRRVCLRKLRAYSSGYQKSCFELLINRTQLKDLLSALIEEINEDSDSLILAPMKYPSHCWQLGIGSYTPCSPLMVIS